MDLPLLHADDVVRFGSAAALREVVRSQLTSGVLHVVTAAREVPLTAQAQLTVQLSGAWLSSPVAVPVEVTDIAPGRTVLRLLVAPALPPEPRAAPAPVELWTRVEPEARPEPVFRPAEPARSVPAPVDGWTVVSVGAAFTGRPGDVAGDDLADVMPPPAFTQSSAPRDVPLFKPDSAPSALAAAPLEAAAVRDVPGVGGVGDVVVAASADAFAIGVADGSGDFGLTTLEPHAAAGTADPPALEPIPPTLVVPPEPLTTAPPDAPAPEEWNDKTAPLLPAAVLAAEPSATAPPDDRTIPLRTAFVAPTAASGAPAGASADGRGDGVATVDHSQDDHSQDATVPARFLTLPPYFTGDALSFHSARALNEALEGVKDLGALLVAYEGKLATGALLVHIAVGAVRSAGNARITLVPTSPGMAVAQEVERGGLHAVCREVALRAEHGATLAPAPPAAAPPPALTILSDERSGGRTALGPDLTFPTKGELRNPGTATEILALPLVRTPADADVARPSAALFLRWLRTTRGVRRVELQAEGQSTFVAVFIEGREVRSASSVATLGKALAQPVVQYTVTELQKAPQLATTARTLHLIAEVVRGLCARCDVDLLAAAFPKKPGLCIRAIPEVVESVGLPAAHQRFARTELVGAAPLDEVVRSATQARTVWDTLYVLALYGGLLWEDAPAGRSTPSGGGMSSVRAVAPALSDPFEGKDHFAVLGLHWSAAPGAITPAYQRLRAEYGPGGMRRPIDATLADKIWKHVETAHRVLSQAATRQDYRRATFNLVWPHQASLLVAQAKLAAYRKDWAEALELLDAAEDVSPSAEAQELMKDVRKKSSARA